MDNLPNNQPLPNPPPALSSEPKRPWLMPTIVVLLVLILALVIFGKKIVKQKTAPAVNSNSKPATMASHVPPTLATSVPISNFQTNTGNILPAQFPSDFPNPALTDKTIQVLQNYSLIIHRGNFSQLQSTFIFSTQMNAVNIQNLYQSYLDNHQWQTKTETLSGQDVILANNSDKFLTINIQNESNDKQTTKVNVELLTNN